jgi:hypothetical protein
MVKEADNQNAFCRVQNEFCPYPLSIIIPTKNEPKIDELTMSAGSPLAKAGG